MASAEGAMGLAAFLFPLLFGLVAVVAVLVYPKRGARPQLAIAMGAVVVIVAVWSGLGLAGRFAGPLVSRYSRPSQPPARTSPATFPTAFSADLSGRLTRRGGTDDEGPVTWLIQSTVKGGLTGSLNATLAGRSASDGGLNVDSGTVDLRSGQGAVCNATVQTIRQSAIRASCGQPQGGTVNLTIQFAVGEADFVTGHLSGGIAAVSSSPIPTPSPSPRSSAASTTHVFVIVMENRSYSDALATLYVSSLAQKYAVANNYHSIGEPSLPNYLALTSGSTWKITDDGYHPLPATGLGRQVSGAGLTWNAYAEGFTGNCFNSPYPYALKHNPFAYYGGGCPKNVVPISQLGGDLAGTTPNLSWIMPGLCSDGHDCSPTTADSWLARQVPAIIASAAWQQGGVLFITWDEGGGSNDHVATLVIAPELVASQSSHYYNHYSLLATIEDRLGVARLGLSAQASPMTDLVR